MNLLQCSAETGKKYSYEELRKLCRRFAIALKQKQFQKGEILSIILPNIPEYLVVLLGTIEAGLVATTLNPAFTAGYYNDILSSFDSLEKIKMFNH